MEPPRQPDTPPPAKVRVGAGGQHTSPLPALVGEGVPGSEGGAPQARRRPNALQVAALALFLLGLVAASTWWVLARQTSGSKREDALPKDSVSLINSTTTPIPERRSPLI